MGTCVGKAGPGPLQAAKKSAAKMNEKAIHDVFCILGFPMNRCQLRFLMVNCQWLIVNCQFCCDWREALQFRHMILSWIGMFDFINGQSAALLVLAAAVFILVIPDLRLALAGLVVQYFGLMLLYAGVIDPRLALVKLLVGWFVCLILLITGQQVNWGRLPRQVVSRAAEAQQRKQDLMIGGRRVPVTAVRGLLALILLAIVWLLAQQDLPFLSTLPDSLAYINLTVYGLVGFGLLGVLTAADELLRAGLGVLMLLAGLELYTTSAAQDQSLIGMVLWAAVNLIVALIIAFLVQKRYAAIMKLQEQKL